MRPLRLQFIVDEENLACSQCEKPTQVLAKLPIVGLADHKQPWIGICRECAERLVSGFDQAEMKSGLEAMETVDGALLAQTASKVEPLDAVTLARLEKLCAEASPREWHKALGTAAATRNYIGALLAEVRASRQQKESTHRYHDFGGVFDESDVVAGVKCLVCGVPWAVGLDEMPNTPCPGQDMRSGT